MKENRTFLPATLSQHVASSALVRRLASGQVILFVLLSTMACTQIPLLSDGERISERADVRCRASSATLLVPELIPASEDTAAITTLGFASNDTEVHVCRAGNPGVYETWQTQNPARGRRQFSLNSVALRGSQFSARGDNLVITAGATDFADIFAVVGSELKGIEIWDASGNLMKRLMDDDTMTPQPRRWTDASISPDGGLVLMAAVGTGYQLVDVLQDRSRCNLLVVKNEETHPTTAVGFSLDGQLFAFADVAGNGAVYSVSQGPHECQSMAHFRTIDEIPVKLAFRPDNRVLAVLTNRSVWLIDIAGFGLGRQSRRIATRSDVGPTSLLGDIRFSPDGQYLAIGTNQGIELREAGTGKAVVSDSSIAANALAFSLTGCKLAVGDLAGNLHLYDLGNGTATGSQ